MDLRRIAPTATLLLACISAPVEAQLPMPGGSGEAEIVRLVEQEGAGFPRYTLPPRRVTPPFVAPTTAGSADRRCSTPVGKGPTRSGEFVIGGEVSGATTWSGRQRKIWWAPFHASAVMHLVVRGVRIGAPADTVRFESDQVAWSVPPRNAPESTRDYFFPSGISFPTDGRWVIAVSSGNDWACFILNLQ